jgi:hypothetical protein
MKPSARVGCELKTRKTAMSAANNASIGSAVDNIEQLKSFLSKKFPLVAQQHYLSLLQSYNSSGLAEEKLFSEIFANSKKGNEGKFWENLWEAMIYRLISHLNYPFISPAKSGKGKLGPDFRFSYNNRKIWIEATSLNPGQNFPTSFLNPSDEQVYSAPFDDMQLRWTNALKSKNEQLAKWVEDKIVPESDPCVIAINSSQLSWWPAEDRGLSQLPWAVEVVTSVGPMAVIDGFIQHSTKEIIKKSNGVTVPKTIFFDPAYSKISAVIGCARNHMLGRSYTEKNDERHCFSDKDFLCTVHNPLAKNPCPQRLSGNFNEYTIKIEKDSWALILIQ